MAPTVLIQGCNMSMKGHERSPWLFLLLRTLLTSFRPSWFEGEVWASFRGQVLLGTSYPVVKNRHGDSPAPRERGILCTGHCKWHLQMVGKEECNPIYTHASPLFVLHHQWTSLLKYLFKDKSIRNFKMASMEHEIKCEALLSGGPG